MSTSRLDSYLPDYVSNVSVVNGQLVVGAFVPLYGATGVSAQVVCQNGASGTLYSNSTNYQNTTFLSNQNTGMGLPTQGASAAAGVNSSNASVVLTQASPGLYLQGVYFTFVASAAGTVNISVNVRRPSA